MLGLQILTETTDKSFGIKILDMFLSLLMFLSNNPIYIGGIICAGIIFTIAFRAVQIRQFGRGWKLMFKSNLDDSEGSSSYKAAALAVGSRVGTGNIAGVTTAILTGGPGAVLWMWVIAFVGMATAFTETTLGQLYKEKTYEHIYVGGPAYYIEKGLGRKWKPLAIFYACIMIISFGLFFLALHTSNIYSASFTAFDIQANSLLANIITGAMILLVGVAVFGGMRILMNITAVIVPFMTIGYFILVAIIIVTNLDFIDDFFRLIFTYAFKPSAFAGATIGTIISTGAKRGIFSNEAGQGSGAIAGATSNVAHPVDQGLVQMNTVFIDTFIVCTLTAFVVLLAGSQAGIISLTGVEDTAQLQYLVSEESAQVATRAFDTVISMGAKLLAIFFFFFAFSSLLGNMSYGMQNVKYLFENKTDRTKKIANSVYGVVVIFFIIITPLISSYALGSEDINIFDIADALASGLFYANVIVMLILFRKIRPILSDYESSLKAKKTPTFDREKFAEEHHFDRY